MFKVFEMLSTQQGSLVRCLTAIGSLASLICFISSPWCCWCPSAHTASKSTSALLSFILYVYIFVWEGRVEVTRIN